MYINILNRVNNFKNMHSVRFCKKNVPDMMSSNNYFYI